MLPTIAPEDATACSMRGAIQGMRGELAPESEPAEKTWDFFFFLQKKLVLLFANPTG